MKKEMIINEYDQLPMAQIIKVVTLEFSSRTTDEMLLKDAILNMSSKDVDLIVAAITSKKLVEGLTASGVPLVFIHDELNQEGSGKVFSRSVDDLREIYGRGFAGTGNWNDEIQSFEIISGAWIFWDPIAALRSTTSPRSELITKHRGNLSDVYKYGKTVSSIELIRA